MPAGCPRHAWSQNVPNAPAPEGLPSREGVKGIHESVIRQRGHCTTGPGRIRWVKRANRLPTVQVRTGHDGVIDVGPRGSPAKGESPWLLFKAHPRAHPERVV